MQNVVLKSNSIAVSVVTGFTHMLTFKQNAMRHTNSSVAACLRKRIRINLQRTMRHIIR